MNKGFLLGCSMLMLMACSQEQKRTESADKMDTGQARLGDTVGPMNYYLMDRYAEAPFEMGQPTLKKIRELGLTGYHEESLPLAELMSGIEADSMTTVTVGGGKLVYYTGPDLERLYYGRLVDNTVKFKNNVRIGMTKTEFVSKFQQMGVVDDLPSVIQIANPDNREVYNFIFYQDTLGMVIYDSYIE